MITTIKYQNIHIVLYKYNYFYDYIVSIERVLAPINKCSFLAM